MQIFQKREEIKSAIYILMTSYLMEKQKALPIKQGFFVAGAAKLRAEGLQCCVAYCVNRLGTFDLDVFRCGGVAAGGHFRVETP